MTSARKTTPKASTRDPLRQFINYAHAWHRRLERAGLSDDEIRLIGGFRGLSEEQQQAFLTWQSSQVIENARAVWAKKGV